MINWYLKFQIRRFIDQGTTFPAWLLKSMKRDSELSRYADLYAQMVRQLSSSANDWMVEKIENLRPGWTLETSAELRSIAERLEIGATQSIRATKRTTASTSRFSNSPTATLALTVVSIMVVTIGWLAAHMHLEDIRMQKESAQQAQKMLVVTRAVWIEGDRVARRSVAACEYTLDKVSQKIADRIGESTVAPLEDGGRWLAVAIKELQAGLQRQQIGLIDATKRFRAKLHKGTSTDRTP